MTTASSLTEVDLIFVEGSANHWIRFGAWCVERILDRRRRVVGFPPKAVFAFVRWQANTYGTALGRIDILRATQLGEPLSTIPGVRPGGEILLRLDGWSRVIHVLDAITAIEALGIDPAEASPDYWRHLQNRVVARSDARPYTAEQHRAWLLRQSVGT